MGLAVTASAGRRTATLSDWVAGRLLARPAFGVLTFQRLWLGETREVWDFNPRDVKHGSDRDRAAGRVLKTAVRGMIAPRRAQ